MAYVRVKDEDKKSRMTKTGHVQKDTQGVLKQTKHGHFIRKGLPGNAITTTGGRHKFTTGGMHWIRKAKGTTVGGQFAKDPNGPMSQHSQAQLLGKHPENIIADQAKAEFKKRKKEAMDRFLAKQKAEKLQAHAVGLPGPVTLKKLEKINKGVGFVPIPMQRKLRKLENQAHALGVPGLNTMEGNNVKPIPANQVKKPAIKVRHTNEVTTGRKHRWVKQMVTGGGERLIQRDLTPVKNSMQLRAEKHQRHIVLRAAKAEELRLEKKRIAGRRHIAKQHGVSFTTPIRNEGQLSTEGKFKWVGRHREHAFGGRNRRVVKEGWRLIPTSDRGNAVAGAKAFVANVHQHAQPHAQRSYGSWVRDFTGHPDWENSWKNMKHPSTFSDGVKQLVAVPSNDQNDQGYFCSMKVEITGDGKGILKTNGMRTLSDIECRDVSTGFAYREVDTYEVSEVLGLGIVPKTEPFIDSKNPLDPRLVESEFHSMQTFVENPTVGAILNDNDFVNSMTDREEVGRMVMLDLVLGNTDRHGNNWLSSNGHLYAIDNGLQMTSPETELRRVKSSWEIKCGLGGSVARNTSGKYQLNSKFKQNLQTALANGSLEKIIRHTEAHTIPSDAGKRLADASMIRARSLVDKWDTVFHD